MKKSKKLMILGLSAATAAVAATGAVSSFAWFATNNTVTATGMKVKIQSASTLLISDTAATNTTNGMLTNGASTKAFSSSTDTIVSPASTVNGADWFTAKAAEANSADAETNGYAPVDDADESKYRLETVTYLQAFDATKKTGSTYDAVSPDSNIVIDSITVTSYDNDDALKTSFRVLAVCDSTTVFCAPTGTATPTNQGVSAVTSGSATKAALTFATVSGLTNNKATLSANNILVDGANYNQVYTVKIYLYFDGEDSTCKTDNIPSADKLKDYVVTVSFSLVDAA